MQGTLGGYAAFQAPPERRFVCQDWHIPKLILVSQESIVHGDAEARLVVPGWKS